MNTSDTPDYAQTAELTRAARREDATAGDQLSAARHLLEQAMPAEALPFLLRASELVPSAELAALAGSVAVSIGALDCASEQFRIQLSRDPEAPEAHANLGLLGAARQHWAEAAQHFQEAVRRAPTESGWHNDLGVVLFQLENYRGAEAALLRAREQQPAHPDAAANLADVYQAVGRTEDAFRVLADYLRYVPGDECARSRHDELFAALPETFRATWPHGSATSTSSCTWLRD